MKAYAILDGGGVKGAALAGCLAAAQDYGVEFVGYGGTSAGAIIAALASVGYTGQELRGIMKMEIKPRSLFPDDGADLEQGWKYVGRLAEILSSDSWLILKARRLKKLARDADPLAKRILNDAGLYTADKLCSILLRMIAEKLPQLRQSADVTFDDLQKARCKPLKIVASDLTHRRAAVFSYEDTGYSSSVLAAVRASVSYPLVFRPVGLLDGRHLADGGLASNLPTFLFAEEHEISQYPILAFDLISPTDAPRVPLHSAAFRQ